VTTATVDYNMYFHGYCAFRDHGPDSF